MAPVTVVRETSVIFGAIIGVTVIREGLGSQRIAAACFVAVVIVTLTLFKALLGIRRLGAQHGPEIRHRDLAPTFTV